MHLNANAETCLLLAALLLKAEEEGKPPRSQAGYVCRTVAKKRSYICQQSETAWELGSLFLTCKLHSEFACTKQAELY